MFMKRILSIVLCAIFIGLLIWIGATLDEIRRDIRSIEWDVREIQSDVNSIEWEIGW
jgi:uncharacterized protein YoxC